MTEAYVHALGSGADIMMLSFSLWRGAIISPASVADV
jgi:hypothetical protein